MSGFVVIQRELFDFRGTGELHPAFKDFHEVAIFTHWITLAAWRDHEVRFQNKRRELKRGELFITLRSYAAKAGVSVTSLRRFIKRLTDEHMIETVSDTGATLIRICNYSKYQDVPDRSGTPDDTEAAHQAAQRRHTSGTQTEPDKPLNQDSSVPSERPSPAERPDSEVIDLFDTSASAPPHADAPPKAEPNLVWQTGLELLRRQGVTERSARSFLGRLVADHKVENVERAVSAALIDDPVEIKAYLKKVASGSQSPVQRREGSPRLDMSRHLRDGSTGS